MYHALITWHLKTKQLFIDRSLHSPSLIHLGDQITLFQSPATTQRNCVLYVMIGSYCGS